MTTQAIRPLYHAEELASSAGYEITYAYDDLVFLAHSEVLLQFADDPENQLNIYLNQELDADACNQANLKLTMASKGQDFTIAFKGRFSMAQQEGEEIQLQFLPGED